MSGTWPSSPGFSSANFRSEDPSLKSEAVSGRRQVRKLAGQRWAFSAVYPSMSRADFAPVMAFVAAQRGEYESFSIVLPTLSTPQGTASGTPLVNGASQTGSSLITDGWANSELVLKAGDVFTVAGNNKVYMVTADGTSDGSGNLTLSISPSLVESPANNAALTVTSVPFTVALSNPVQEFALRPGVFFDFEVDMAEVLSA
jgi:hypothetical protein|tara:strand:+ start:843 stop:1445 length:603 start_codon:yes stop_codon:yes gene_type:complete